MYHIFISYSRKDLITARRIVTTLKEHELETWFDWDSIPKGEAWELEIYRGIEEADVLLFLISPDSVQSEMCNKEVLHAIRNNKRILPVLLKEVGSAVYWDRNADEKINSLNWIFCREERDLFPEAIDQVEKTIRTDYDWVRFHTSLQVKALAWDRSKNDNSRLLRGKELKEAEKKISSSTPARDPNLTEIQEQFIQKSKRSAQRRKSLPYKIILALMALIFFGGKFYFLVIPLSNACPKVNKVSTRLDAIDQKMPPDVRARLNEIIKQSNFETSLTSCGETKKMEVIVTAGYDVEKKMIELTLRLPETAAYTMDLLPEIREFGPELVSEQETTALLKAAAAYSVGEYSTAIKTLTGFKSLSALTLTAQAQLFSDDYINSQQTYHEALQVTPQPNEVFTGKLYMGAALSWWRPESYYQLSFEGKKSNCLKAGDYYAQPQQWLESSSLAYNTRIIYAYYCVDENDSAYERFKSWKLMPARLESDPSVRDASSVNILQQYILALESSRSSDLAVKESYEDHLMAAQDLMLAQAALSEFIWGKKDNCKDAGAWRDIFRSGVFSTVEKTKLRKLLQNQPLFCR